MQSHPMQPLLFVQGVAAFVDASTDASSLGQKLEMLLFTAKVGIAPQPKLLDAGALFLHRMCAVKLGEEGNTEMMALIKLLNHRTRNMARWMMERMADVLWVMSVNNIVMEESLANNITYELSSCDMHICVYRYDVD